LPPAPPIALVVEVEPEARFEISKLAAEPGRLDQASPLPWGEREDHHPPAVPRHEVAAERPENVVAETPARLGLEHSLTDESQVPRHREADVREAELDKLTFTGEAAVPVGGEDGRRGEETGHRVPGRQHVVHGTLGVLGPGDE